MKAKYILSTLGAGLIVMMPQAVLAQKNITWNNAGATNNWNTTAANWTGDGTVFASGDNTTFTGATAEAITVDAPVTVGTFTANHSAGTYSFTGASITGTSLSKSDGGILAFAQTNTFNSITVSGGPNSAVAANAALVFNISNALGTAPITLSNTARITAINTNGVNMTVNNPIALTTTANVTTNLLGKTATTQTYNGLISGGSTTGTLFLNMDASGSDGVTKLANTANTFSANRITVNRGVVAITADGSLGAPANQLYLDTTSLNGGLRFDGNNITIARPIQFNDYARINVNGSTGAEISSTITGTAGNRGTPYTISGGSLKLSGANTFYHYLDVASGASLIVANASALGTSVGAADRTRVSSGGSLVLDNLVYGSAENLEISGSGIGSAGALTTTSGSSVFPGPISLLAASSVGVSSGASLSLSGVISGAFDLSKVGAGTLTLSGTNAYTGNTIINQGSVIYTGQAIPAGGFTIAPGATLDITGLTNPLVLASDSTLRGGRASSPANDVIGSFSTGTGHVKILEGNAAGTLSVSGNLTLNGGSVSFDLSNSPASGNDLVNVGGVLNLNTSTTININRIDGLLGNGVYVLATASSTSGSVSNLTFNGLPAAGTSRQSFTPSLNATQLILTVTGVPSSLSWNNAAATGKWSVSLADDNWNNTTLSDNQDAFFAADLVTFADISGQTSQTVDIASDVEPGALLVNNTAAGTAYVWSGNSNIIGSTGLVKSGDGTLSILSESHSFSGNVQINGGTVGVQLINDSGLPGSLGAGSVITLNGGGIAYDSLFSGYTNRSITLAGNGAVKITDENVELALDGVISGSGSFTKQGLGRLILNANNSYTGDTIITAGTLIVGNGAANGTISNGAIFNDGVLVLNRNVNFSLNQAVSGTGSILKQTGNTLTMPSANSYSGGTTIVAGTVLALHPSALGSGPITQTGGALRFSFGNGTTTTVTNAISLNTVGNTTFTIRGTADAAPTSATTVRLTGKISGGAAGQTFNLVDSGSTGNHLSVIELRNANNDFQGTILMNRGTLGFDSDAALGHPDNDIEHFTENLNGSLRFDADNIVLGAGRTINMPPAVNFRPINTQSFTATIQGNITGSGIFVKQGTGTLIFTGTNSNTSATTVAAGTLQVDGTFATSTGVVTVDVGATLSGGGSIDRPITIAGSIAPGAGVGPLTTGAVTINGTYACEVNGATSDLIAATNLTLGTASMLNVTDTTGVFPRTIATYSGTLTGTFATVSSGYAVDYSTPGQIILRKSGYGTWASNYASGGAANADSDNDGVPNGVEYFMGVNTAGFTANPRIINNEITWPKDNTVTDAAYVVEYSTDLNLWTTATSGVTDSGTTVKYTVPTGQSSYFVRLRVTITP